MPDGVPMPLKEDPAYKDWSWFPHGEGKDFTLTKCLEPLEPLRDDVTVMSGLSHPAVRSVHGHSNADQFLTGADTGAAGDYQNSISQHLYIRFFEKIRVVFPGIQFVISLNCVYSIS